MVESIKTSISTLAYNTILDEITSGKIVAGTAISEHSLAKKMGISRTPVREAIRRLKHEGVVEQYPRCGTVVRYPSADEIRKMYQFREALECYVVRYAASVATTEDIRKLEALVERNREMAHALREGGEEALSGDALKQFVEVDMAFHQYLLGLSGNRRILKSVQESSVITRIFGTPRQSHDLSTVSLVYRRHARIVQCLRDGDGEKAAHYMAEHISASCEKMLEHYRKREEQGAIPSAEVLDIRIGLTRSRMAEKE